MNLQQVQPLPPFGVALYDDAELQGEDQSGWCSEAGNPSSRFSRASDLPNNVIWLTNAEYDAARKVRQHHVHNLRGQSFLPTTIKGIAEDLRLAEHDVNRDVASRALSSIVDRTCRHASKLYEGGQELFSGFSLSAGIQNKLFASVPQVSPELAFALQSAYQRQSSCNSKGMKFIERPRFVRLRPNRVVHAIDTLSGVIPDGPVEFIRTESRAVSSPEHWLDKAVLARVVVSNVDPKVEPILAFGSSFSKPGTARVLREWVSTPELLLLSEYADVSVRAVWHWEKQTTLPEHQQLPAFFSDPTVALSYSAGLLAEAHLAAALAQTPVAKQAAAGDSIKSPRAVFLAARERVLMFMLAKAIRDEGFQVVSYGSGGVMVRISHGQVSEINDFVRESGLSFPLPLELTD